MQKKKAFTLIELLVVVAIMGLLAGMAVVALNQAREKARNARRIADIKQIQTALELYYMDQAGYPPTPGVLPFKYIDGTCLGGDGFKPVGTACGAPTYMGLVPTNPFPRTEGNVCGDTGYTYVSAAYQTSYQIYWCLSGGTQGTGGVPPGNHVATPAGLVDGTF